MSYGMTAPQYQNKTPSGYTSGRMQNFTPEMMELFSQMFGHVGPESYTARLASGDQKLFEEMEAPALRQFSGEMGNLASRFSQGGLGARKSTGFQNEATSAASNFSQDLQSKRQELQRQAIKDLMGMSNDLLKQRPYDNYLVEKKKKEKSGGGWGGLIGAGLGGAVGLLGGPFGAMQGAQLGYGIGSAF